MPQNHDLTSQRDHSSDIIEEPIKYNSNFADTNQMTKLVRECRGIFANLLIQGLTLDVLNGTPAGRTCPQTELSNMVATKVGIQASGNGGK